MKKCLILFVLLCCFKNSFSQCTTTYSTVNLTVSCTSFPVSYDNNYYYYSGQYTIYLTNLAGCDSIVTLNILMPPVGTSTTYLTLPACALPYNWGGEDIYQSGVYPNYINVYGCSPDNEDDSVANLNLTVTASDTIKTTTTICSAQVPYYWDGQYYDVSGQYFFNSNDNNPYGIPPPNCYIDELNLTIISNGTSTTDTTICANHLPFKWNGMTFTSAGTYTDSIKNGTLCDSLAVLNLAVNSNASGTTNVTVCANQLPYVWNGKSYNSTGLDTTVIAHAGCDSLAILNLVVKSVAVITSISPTTATKGQSVIIMGKGFLNVFNVSFGSIPASLFTIENDSTIIATVDSAASGIVAVTTSCNTSTFGGLTFNPVQGNIGIGLTKAPSKLTVAGGDIYVTDIGSGIILKSPDGTCWKLYMSNTEGGINGLHIVQVPCPQ